jgi:hypothetical protein
MSALLPIIFHCNPCKHHLLLLYVTITINMKLSFTLFILPLVAAAAHDGHLRDSSPVETANAAADRHHLRRVLTAESVQSSCLSGDCTAESCSSNKVCKQCDPCANVNGPCALAMGHQCVNRPRPPKDVDGSILEEE